MTRTPAHLAPFVRPAVPALVEMLAEIGRADLIRQHGHYEMWLGGDVARRARRQALAMEKLEVPTQPAPAELVESARRAARADDGRGPALPELRARSRPARSGARLRDRRHGARRIVPAARSADAAHRRRRHSDHHRRRADRGALGHRVRRRVVGAAAGAVRPESAARGRAWLPRADARRDAARRCAPSSIPTPTSS